MHNIHSHMIIDAELGSYYGRQFYVVGDVHMPKLNTRFGKPDQIRHVYRFAPNRDGNYEFVEHNKLWESTLGKMKHYGHLNDDIDPSEIKLVTMDHVTEKAD